MSDMVTVPTPFEDVSELAQGFVGRVNDEQLLLPVNDAVPEGEHLQFVVLLADGTAAFGGEAQCVQVSDRGEHLPPEEPRYELLLEALEMEEASRAVFDHLIAVRNAAYAAQEPQEYAEPDADEGYAEPEVAQAASDDEQAWAPFPEDHGTEEVYEGALEEVVEPQDEGLSQQATADPGLEQAPEEFESIDELAESVRPEAAPEPPAPLTRAVVQTTQLPQPPPRPEPRPSTGLFVFQGEGLPVPPGPPRPQLDPSQRVAPAPKPNGAGHAAAAQAPAAAPEEEAHSSHAPEPEAGQAADPEEPLSDDELISLPPEEEASAEASEQELHLDEEKPRDDGN